MITMPDAGSLYKENALINQNIINEGKVCITPTPLQQKELDGELEISATTNIFTRKVWKMRRITFPPVGENSGVRIGRTEGNKDV